MCTGARLGSRRYPHLCSRPAANSSRICNVTLTVHSSRRSRSSSKHTTKISLHTDKTWSQEWGECMHEGKTDVGRVYARGEAKRPVLCSRGRPLSLTHNNTHASAYRLRYSCSATHITPSRARTSRDARRVSSESSPVRERRTLLTNISRRQEREYRGPSTWCANARTRSCASSAYLASRDVAAERTASVTEASPKSIVAL
jgi:hypothetical protein